MYFKFKDIYKLKVKGWKICTTQKISFTNISEKEPEIYPGKYSRILNDREKEKKYSSKIQALFVFKY